MKSSASFKGVKRRFEYHVNQSNFIMIDDYAHHPQELRALINSLRLLYDKQEILNLGIIAVENIRLIHESKLRLYYDLRFIFELVLLGFDINHKIVRKYYGINFILNKIRKSISFSRSETILNINNEISLRSLHYLFEPLLNDVLTYEKEGHRYEIYQKQWIYI